MTEQPPLSKAAAEAHKRAMPLQRLTGNGMDYADVVALYAGVDSGTPWDEAAENLGNRNIDRAEREATAGHSLSARSWYLAASCCYRVGQAILADGPRKHEMFAKMVDAYGKAGDLFEPPFEHLDIPHRGGTLSGWLALPGCAGPTNRWSLVIVMGGFDGWREEYHVGATYLRDRGVATFLVDGPGQGESRLFGGLVLDHDFPAAFSAVIDYLVADDRLNGRVGIWGNSMGGFMAASVAASDGRIEACCVNGGTGRPAEVLDRFPRFVTKVQLLLGVNDADKAIAEMGTYVLTDEQFANLTCPLLILHGTPDQVFLVENARALHGRAASTDKTFLEWPDGDHCIYNHSHDKHTRVSDWFADRLTDTLDLNETPTRRTRRIS
ncbi:MAG: alpha/beta hydrolase [Nocardioides sp.]|uniref:alpha/beta hydrolase family protein n=1 Tax=Nocardioides sp. TaxID=35761 RepID=UPI0039E2EC58